MMLIISYLRLRSLTSQSQFGCDLKFDKPFSIIRAGNTSGKSTCLQAIIYALGLERSFGPRTGIPITFAMQERIQRIKDGPYETVLQSFVEMEVKNSAGASLTIRRDIAGGTETKLIQTWPSSYLSDSRPRTGQRDFFVHDPGAAQHDAGFHTFLAEFIGLRLPRVTRFDGGESPLYLEALFPMFFVEQKRGWSAIQGPFPTHLQIQDVARRVMEFILDLDIGKARRELADVRVRLREALSQWSSRRDDLLGNAKDACRIMGVPTKPTPEFVHNSLVTVEYFHGSRWVTIDEARAALVAVVSAPRSAETASVQAPEIERELVERRRELDDVTLRQENLRTDERAQRQQQLAVKSRLADLQTDLERNQDALKLKNLGSRLGDAASDHHCPTCHQDVQSELMPSISGAGMAIDQNIAFIKSQIVLHEASAASIERNLAELQSLLGALQQQSAEIRSRMRALRQTLVQPSDVPSIAALEAAITAQAKIDHINVTQERVDAVINDLTALAREYVRLDGKAKELSKAGLTSEDRRKIGFITTSMRNQLTVYGYKSFLPAEIKLAEDNLRPIAEVIDRGEAVEREIGLNDSASDGTRLKWSYYLAILALAKSTPLNHLQLAIFDEPGQQVVEWKDLREFLRWIAKSIELGQQVIISTSESLEHVKAAVADFEVTVLDFDGFILKPLS